MSGSPQVGKAQRADRAAQGALAGPPPATTPAASPAPPTTLEAVCTAELLCRLAGSGRRGAAQRLLCTPQAWPLKNMRALDGMRFASARLTTPLQGGLLRLRVRVHMPARAADTMHELLFVLRTGADGWRAVSVRPVRLLGAHAPPR